MAVKTASQLDDKLDESFAWRRIELSALQSEIRRLHRTSPEAPLTRALARSGVALTYAHWEGFVKDACQYYLDYVAVRRLKYGELSDSFVLTALRDLVKRMGDDEACAALLEAMRRPDEARARIPRRGIIQTRSNLRYEVLGEIFDVLGFPLNFFETKENFIDRSLCDARNEVAHGRDMYPDPEDIDRLVSDVIDMLEHTRDLVREHVRQSKYRV